MRSCDPHDAGTRAPSRRRHFTASVVALILSATAPHGAAQPTGGPGWTGPDFSLYVSAEEAVVVSIRTSTSRRDRTEDPECPAGLDRESPLPRPAACGRQAEERTLASGFLISSEGYILTNAHVVVDVDSASVQLIDRRQYTARCPPSGPSILWVIEQPNHRRDHSGRDHRQGDQAEQKHSGQFDPVHPSTLRRNRISSLDTDQVGSVHTPDNLVAARRSQSKPTSASA